jgi:dipeptidyl aminopeptidase/acylaminoacyl peptidase
MKRITRCLAVIAWLAMTAARATPPLEAYGHLPAVEMMQLSPSGARYAFIAVIGEKRRLGVVSFEGKPLFVNDVGDTKVRDLIWADDTHLLATISGTIDQPFNFVQPFEAGAVIAFGMDGKAVPIFKNALHIAGVVRGYFGSARLDGHVYGYFGGITYADTRVLDDHHLDHVFPDVYRVDLDSGKTFIEATGRRNDRDWVVNADGTVLAHSEYDEEAGHWQLCSGKAHSKTVIEKSVSVPFIELQGHGRGPGTALISDEGGEHDVLEEVAIADGKSEDLLGNHTVHRPLFDPDNRYLIGLGIDEEPRAIFFDRKLQARYDATRKAFPGYEVELESFSRDLARMIVKTDGKDDAGTYWLVDIASGKADPVGYPYPEIHSSDVGSTRLVRYKAADGLDIEGVLTLPPDRKPEKLPLVMLPHGGPIDVRDHIGFDWWAQAYAAAGYAVLQPNYRGSGGYGAQFRQAGYGEWGRKMQTDLSDGIAALAEQGLIDPKRVCIVGGSYGGYAALAGVTLQLGIYRCAVSVAGPSDMKSFFGWQIRRHGYEDTGVTRYFRAVTGADKSGDEAMRSISPALLADRADAPVLLIHGKDDTVVPIEQSEEMAAALKRAEKSVEFVVMPGEDHWLSREATRIQMLKAAVEFVKKHNPPG